MTPADIFQSDAETLGVKWQDGHESRFRSDYLRLLCQCAGCVDEWTGVPKLDPNSISSEIRPNRVQGVGRYGIKIDWNDGHNTGIYTFQFLREICPCATCKPNGVSHGRSDRQNQN